MAASIHWTSKETCTTKECIEKGVTTHYINWYWVIYPELYTKYSLHQMQTKRSNQNLKKANIPAETVKKRKNSVIPKINSWEPKVLAVERPQ